MYQFEKWFDRFLIPIDDPTSRLFHLNLIFCLGFIFIWILFQKRKNNKLKWRYLKILLFSKSYWWNTSTQTDYKLYILNSLFKIFLFIPFLDFSYKISLFLLHNLRATLADFSHLNATSVNLFIFTLGVFIFDDFLRFVHHKLMHKIPLLWQFHATHHAATTLTPMTLYRTHPVESAIATIRNSLALGLATGLFIFLFNASLTMTTILGINFFGFLFNLLGSNLRHSQIPFSFGWLEFVFISPLQHQLHHSKNPAHFEKNFGVSLSIWDRLSGSLLLSQSWKNSNHTKQKLKFGLD